LNIAKRSYGLSKSIFQTRWKTSVYGYQLHTWINRSKIRWQRDPFYYWIHSTYGVYWNKSWWCLLRRRNTYSERS